MVLGHEECPRQSYHQAMHRTYLDLLDSTRMLPI